MKKGFILTWDATIALSFVILVLVGFLSIPYFKPIGTKELGFQKTHVRSEDAMEVFVKSGKLGTIGGLWDSDDYSTPAQMGNGDIHGASLEAKTFLDSVVPEQIGYELYIGGTLIYSSDLDNTSDRLPVEDSREKTRSIRFMSGYSSVDVSRGWVASASLSSNTTGYVDWLWLYDAEQSDFDMVLDRDNMGETPYLVLPKTAYITSGTLNISWEPLCSALGCPPWGS